MKEMNQLKSDCKDELKKSLKTFLNEMTLSFDELLGKIVCSNLDKIKKKLDDSTYFDGLAKDTFETLNKHKDSIQTIVSKGKVKTSEYDFLNDISLFSGALDMKVFASENKNTKKMLVKYLHTFYTACFMLTLQVNLDLDNLQELFEKTFAIPQVQVPQQRVRRSRKSPSQDTGLDGLMSSLMGNDGVMEIASSISSRLQSDKIDPMSLLSSIMSGGGLGDSNITSLITDISQQIESKIDSGELDASALESQAKQLMSSVGSSGPGSSIPNIADLAKLFTK
jgi:hypothetical protein